MKLDKDTQKKVAELFTESHGYDATIRKLSILSHELERKAWEMIKEKAKLDSTTITYRYDSEKGEIYQAGTTN